MRHPVRGALNRPPLWRFLLACLLPLLVLSGPVDAAAPPAVSISISRNADTWQVYAYTDVAVSPSIAWAVLTDFEAMPAYVSGLRQSQVRQRSGNLLLVYQSGVARFGPVSLPYETEREFLLEAPRRLSLRGVSGNAQSLVGEVRLQPQARGLRLIYQASLQPQSPLVLQFGAAFLRAEVSQFFDDMTREMRRRQSSGGR